MAAQWGFAGPAQRQMRTEMTSGWAARPSKSSDHTGTAAWKRVRRRVLARDGYECQLRGPRCTFDADHVDHIIPVTRGGTDDASNLKAVCLTCHASKSASEAVHGRASHRRRRPPPSHPAGLL